MKYIFAVVLSIFLVGCDSNTSFDMTGTYVSKNGAVSFTVLPNNKLRVNTGFSNAETDYTTENNKIKYQFLPGISESLEIHRDGTAVTPSGEVFKKK